MAMIKRTGGADFPDKLKALVCGPPKSGKTTLLGTVPNIIIADTEPKANNLASLAHLDIPYVTIGGMADLRELLMVLGNDSLRAQAALDAGMTSIDAVAIDTLDTLQKIMKRERMEEQRTTKFLRDDWSWLKEEMTKIVEAYTALPLHVIFTVHLKTQEIGSEQNPQTKILPGLEGAIATDIAGMVGYSLRSFRKEEFDAASGNRYTKYWLQAEGDETYDFLGTRTAGRLPSIIEPNFGTIYNAAMAGRPSPQPQAPVQMPASTQQAGPPPVQMPQAPQESGPNVGPTEPAAQTVVPDSAPQAPESTPGPQDRAGDEEPINEVALQHVKKVYDAMRLNFPEDKLRGIKLGDARTLVKMWAAIQVDAAEGKMPEGNTVETEMTVYLEGMGLMPDASTPAPEAEKTVEPKLGGTIPEVKAYVGDDLARANEAFEYERTNGNRKTLMDWLESKGARHGGTPAAAPAEVQTPVENQPEAQAPEAPAPVTQEAPAADVPPTEEEAAVQAVQEGLGGVVIAETINADAQCESCAKQIDDADIAKLSKTRFGKVLCVDDYIAATRA